MFLKLLRSSAWLIVLISWLCSPQSSRAQQQYKTTITYRDFGNSGSPLIRVTFRNGMTGNFLLDTGSDVDVITDTLAAKLNLTPKPYDKGPLSIQSEQQANVVEFIYNIGRLPFQGLAVVVNANQLKSPNGESIDGLVGTSTLSSLAVLLDVEQHQVTLFYPGNLTLEVRKSLQMDNAATIDRSINGKFSFYVPVRFNDKVTTDLAIDTGAANVYILPDIVKQLKLKSIGQAVDTATLFGTVKKLRVSVRSLQLGTFTLRDQDIYYAEKGPAKLPPHLGMDVLSHYCLLIDYPADKLYIKPASGTAGGGMDTMPHNKRTTPEQDK